MKSPIFSLLLFFLVYQSCIGDDVIFDTVEPEIRIMNPIDTMELGSSYQFKFSYFNNIGQPEIDINPIWKTDNAPIISITPDGTAFAEKEGTAIISIEYTDVERTVNDSIEIVVGNRTVINNNTRNGTIKTTSTYQLEGDFYIEENGSGGITIQFADNFVASSSLPGLYVYLSNNPNSISGAKELQKITTFRGAHSINVSDVGLNDFNQLLYFCKPFNVKVGNGEIN